jgi:hypothetical protein
MSTSSPVGWVALLIWAAAVDPADVGDDQIGLGHIQPGIKQAGDDADLPRIACRSATTEDQGSPTHDRARYASSNTGNNGISQGRTIVKSPLAPWRVASR